MGRSLPRVCGDRFSWEINLMSGRCGYGVPGRNRSGYGT